jgi:predicted flap endonuclease-1-like 5' DNA nuclease
MVGKFFKVVGFVGGLAALAWAMRDRFISVAVSREPEPPAFKGMAPGVDLVDGIGPVFASRLSAVGLGDVSALAGSDPKTVSGAAQVSADRARAWIDRAAKLT